jgi:hypothetical protein
MSGAFSKAASIAAVATTIRYSDYLNGDLFRVPKHDVTIEASFGRPYSIRQSAAADAIRARRFLSG